METFIGLFFIAVTLYSGWMSFMMDTENLLSFTLFKTIPFFLALASAFLAFNHYGFIIQLG